jgi:hypothetical protein
LKLNDFNKAKNIYNKIIERNIDTTITERALLDIASQYLHEGKINSSDSIINIVTKKYPNGSYAQKKQASQFEKNKGKDIENIYNEAYFLSQIGNWEQLEKIANTVNVKLVNTKWMIPFEFIKVKMYAQQKQDLKAIQLLDTIILKTKNDLIKDKAKNIQLDIKNRKDTEKYLSTLDISKPSFSNEIMTDSLKQKKSSTKIIEQTIDPILNSIYKKDTTEPYYISIVASKINAFTANKIKDSISTMLNLENLKLKIGATISQIDNGYYVVWIGPIENMSSSIKIIKNIKAKINKDLSSILTSNQYDIFTVGKSNIIQIKNIDDFMKYKDFMQNNIYK